MRKDLSYKTSFPLIECFDENLFDNDYFGNNFLLSERRKSLGYFKKNNLPSVKKEDWKYFDLKKISKLSFNNANNLNEEEKKLLIRKKNIFNQKIVIINGEYCSNLSDTSSVRDKIEFYNLNNKNLSFEKDKFDYIKKYLCAKDESLDSINLAFAKDIFILEIKKGCTIDEPLEIIYLSKSHDDSICINPRLIVISHEASDSTIIETCQSDSSGYLWSNYVTNIVIEKNARLKHYKYQNEGINSFHTADTKIELSSFSYYSHYLLNSGSDLSRNKIHCKLNNNNGTCNVSGAYFLNESQKSDIFVEIEHLSSDCISNQKFYGVVDSNSEGIFQGKIHVGEETKNTQADQISRGVVLSSNAQINAKPELNIYSEDVQCSHGVSIGELDDESIFYMRSRGISENEARQMLIYAFITDTLSELDDGIILEKFNKLIDKQISEKFF